MLYISICLTLLTILAALHLLAKARKENLGSFTTWTVYAVTFVAALILLCQLARGIRMMRSHDGKCERTEQCGPVMGCLMGKKMMMGHGCNMGGGGMCMPGNMGCGGGMGMRGAMNCMSGCGHHEMGCCKNSCSEKACCGGDDEAEGCEGAMMSGHEHGDSTSCKNMHKEMHQEKETKK